MNNLATNLKTIANKTPIIKPVKDYLVSKVRDFQYEKIKSDSAKHIYQIYGVRRSGNHAIIEWIIENSPSSGFFCNDVSLNHSPKSARRRKAFYGEKPNILMVSYENIKTDFINNITCNDVGEYKNLKNILILRDPFNLFASWYNWEMFFGEKFRENSTYRESVVDTWIQNAKLYLELQQIKNPNLLVINYNSWMASADYRIKLSRQLEINETNNLYDKTPVFGQGSSFKNDSDQELTRLNRFLKFKDDPVFRSIFNNEVWSLSNKIFGEIQNSEVLKP